MRPVSRSEDSLTPAPLTSGTLTGPLLPVSSSDSAGSAHVPPDSVPPAQNLRRRVGCKPGQISEKQLAARRSRKAKAPKDSRVYKVAWTVVALRAQGMKTQEIADQLGLTMNTIHAYMTRATAQGFLNINNLNDPDDQLEYVLKSKTVRNINEFLDERDKEVTIEVAKGTGMLKQHQVVKGEQTTNTMVALKVDVQMPSTVQGTLPALREGSIGGTPAVLLAEIVNEGEGQ